MAAASRGLLAACEQKLEITFELPSVRYSQSAERFTSSIAAVTTTTLVGK